MSKNKMKGQSILVSEVDEAAGSPSPQPEFTLEEAAQRLRASLKEDGLILEDDDQPYMRADFRKHPVQAIWNRPRMQRDLEGKKLR